jgi:hypothetical protein
MHEDESRIKSSKLSKAGTVGDQSGELLKCRPWTSKALGPN